MGFGSIFLKRIGLDRWTWRDSSRGVFECPLLHYDAVVYGSTPSGVIAATMMARAGLRVALVNPLDRVGGLMTSGLCALDLSAPHLIVGPSREFFERAGCHYGSKLEWRPEPHVAERIFSEMLAEAGTTPILGHAIVSLAKTGNLIERATLDDGRQLVAAHWIDASYEGDLLPLAGLDHRSGRESRAEFGEIYAGRSAYGTMVPGGRNRVSGLSDDGRVLPYLTPPTELAEGDGDDRLQSFCYRLTMTRDPAIRMSIPEPDAYDPKEMELFRRLVRESIAVGMGGVFPKPGGTHRSFFFNLALLPNAKYDMNSGPAAPINMPLGAHDWLGSDTAGRAQIQSEYLRFTTKMLHFIRTDPCVPEETQRFFSEFGFCRDEYRATGGWPPELYVREGRRLRGCEILTEQDVLEGRINEAQAIATGRYALDCKPIQWTVDTAGTAVREGMLFVDKPRSYSIRYGMLLPKPDEAANMLVSVAASATHIGYSSLRMEPHWIAMGAAAGAAVALAVSSRTALHGLDPRTIRAVAEGRTRLPAVRTAAADAP